jgi:hypothetical protein
MAKERRKYTPEEIKMLERYAGLGATHKQMAHIVGVCLRAFEQHLEIYPELRAAVDVGAAHSAMQVMQTAFTMATSGEQPAMTIFWLKTRCQWREVKEPLAENPDKADKIKSMPTSELIKLVKEKVG